MTRSILRTILCLGLLLCAGITQAAKIIPSKNYLTRPVSVGSFTALRTNTAIDIEYTVGPHKVQLYAPDNLLPYIKITLHGSELIVSYKEDMQINGNHKSKLIVSAPNVNTFTTASAGDITIKSNIVNDTKIKMSILSAGDITARDITSGSVNLTTNSAGDIEVGRITANEIKMVVNSAGDITATDVKARKQGELRCNSAGDIKLNSLIALKMASINANSAGDIKINEVSADNVSVHANSAGDIKLNDVKATELTAGANSAGTITLAGITNIAKLTCTSTGDIKGRNLKASDVTASVYGGGDIYCTALDCLTASRNSIGKIYYGGKPARVVISGSSKREDGIEQL